MAERDAMHPSDRHGSARSIREADSSPLPRLMPSMLHQETSDHTNSAQHDLYMLTHRKLLEDRVIDTFTSPSGA